MKEFLKLAQQAAGEAGELLKQKITYANIIGEKRGAVDIVTDADVAAQKLIISIISKRFPRHGILAEEAEVEIRKESGYIWAIDPIDGTSAYAHGLPTYSSSIALLKDGQPIVGAIYVALTDEVIWAVKGKGAFCRKNRLGGASTVKLRKTAVGFDPGYFQREEYIKKIAAPLADRVRIILMTWSQAASLALVARGNLGGYIQCGSPKVWDVAAGKLIVEEAGGVVTDFSGDKVDLFSINGYVAGTPSIYRQLLSFTS